MQRLPGVLRATLGALALAGAVAAALAALDRLARPAIDQLEAEDTRTRTQRVLTALADEIEDVSELAADYANWDETWNFMRTRDPGYPDRALPSARGASVRIHAVLLLDEAGNGVFGRWLDLDAHRDQPLPEPLLATLSDARVIATRTGPRRGGLLATARGILLVTARPILPTGGAGLPRGTLVMARRVDDWQIEKLTRQSRYTLALRPVSEAERPARHPGEVDVSLEEATSIGAVVLEDVFAAPAVLVHVEARRRLPALWAGLRLHAAVALGVVAALGLALGAWAARRPQAG